MTEIPHKLKNYQNTLKNPKKDQNTPSKPTKWPKYPRKLKNYRTTPKPEKLPKYFWTLEFYKWFKASKLLLEFYYSISLSKPSPKRHTYNGKHLTPYQNTWKSVNSTLPKILNGFVRIYQFRNFFYILSACLVYLGLTFEAIHYNFKISFVGAI